MEALTFQEIMRQSLVMPVLLVFSVICVAVAYENDGPGPYLR
jgi:hypothetical protein